MKTTFFLIFILLAKFTFGSTYYFSSTTGDDNRSSLQAQSPGTPWKTLDKLNTFFGNLNAGDVVLLNRGDVFYGSIKANKSGAAGQPITISAYGTGSKPIISGLTTLSNWVSVGNGIWESYNGALGTSVNTVLLNNAAQQVGRYPNADAANKGYLTYKSHSNTSITDNQLSSSPNWTGAEVVIRKLYWIMDRNVITSHSGGTLTYISGSGYSPWQDNSGYFIQNDIRTLDEFGEWYYNPSTKKMSVYFGGSSPSNYIVEASSLDNLVTNSYNVGNIVFDNLTFKGSNSNAIQLAYGDNISMNYCDILFSGVDGIKCVNSQNFQLQNSHVANSNNNGVSLENANNNAILRNNTIENTHLFAGMGKSGDGNGFGVQIVGNGNLVEYNQVLNTGYSGIFFSGNSVVVKNNFINNYCLIKDDGAGIYTNTEPNEVSYTGRKITGNVVLNGKGSAEGLADGVAHAHGMYLDGLTTGLEVSGNTVANNTGYGIFCPNPSNVNLNNNTVYNNSVQFVLNHSIKNYSVYNNIVNNNSFFSKLSSQMVLSLTSIGDDINGFGSFDSNYYARPFDDKTTLQNQYVNATGTVSEVYDLETWKAKYNKDASSKRSPVQFPGFTVNNLIGSNTFTNGAFNNNINDVGGWTALNNMVLSYANGVLDGGCLQVSFNAVAGTPGSSLVTMPIGGLTANKKYLLKFSLKGSNDNLSLGAYLRKDGGAYNPITATQFTKIASTRTENQLLFSVPADETSAAVVFTVDNQNIKFWLDNIQFQEADVTIANPDDYIRFEYNGTNNTKTVNLDKSYVDLKNNKYTNTVTLQPYSSIILLKNTQTTSPGDNTPPTITPKNITVQADANGQATIQPSDVIQSITGNNAIDQSSITVSQSQFNCSSGTATSTNAHQAFTSATNKGNQAFGGELGLFFNVNSPGGIIINQLGAFDHDGNGILGSENGGVRVAIFNRATKSIVPGLDVNISGFADGYIGNHQMKNITPVTLMPGEYLVVAKGYNKDELNYNTSGNTLYAGGDRAGEAITLIGGGLYGSEGSGFNYPTNVDGGPGYRYFAGTFAYLTSGNNNSSINTVTITAKDILGNVAHANATVTLLCGQPNTVQSQSSNLSARSAIKPEESLISNSNNSIKVFPNPTNGAFSVELPRQTGEKVSIQILTESGKLVTQRTISLNGRVGNLKEDFNLNNQATGIYLIKVITSKGVQIDKLVLSR
jgi:hypothetical protein